MTELPDIQTEALQLFSADEASYYRLLPCRRDDGSIVSCIGEEGRDYSASMVEIKAIYGFDIRIAVVPQVELARLLSTCYRQATGHGAGTKELPVLTERRRGGGQRKNSTDCCRPTSNPTKKQP